MHSLNFIQGSDIPVSSLIQPRKSKLHLYCGFQNSELFHDVDNPLLVRLCHPVGCNFSFAFLTHFYLVMTVLVSKMNNWTGMLRIIIELKIVTDGLGRPEEFHMNVTVKA